MAKTNSQAEVDVRGLSLESMRLFLAAYEERNFTRAAERSNIALSALAKRIQDLELHLESPLFERHARGIAATPAGDEFAYHVRDILMRINVAQSSIREFASGVRGRIRISATPSAIVGGLANTIVDFGRAFPEVRVDVRESESWSILPDIERGQAQLGLNMSELAIPPGMTAQVYRQADLVAVVTEEHPLARESSVTFARLLDYDHVVLGGTKSTLCTRCIEMAEDQGRVFRYRTVSSFDVMRSMVGAGFGIGIMPELMAHPRGDEAHLHIIPIVEDWARRYIRVWYRHDFLAPASRTFLDFLLAHEPSRRAESDLQNH